MQRTGHRRENIHTTKNKAGRGGEETGEECIFHKVDGWYVPKEDDRRKLCVDFLLLIWALKYCYHFMFYMYLCFFLFMKNFMHREVIDCIPVLEQLCWGGGNYEIVTELSSGFNVVRLAISLLDLNFLTIEKLIGACIVSICTLKTLLF